MEKNIMEGEIGAEGEYALDFVEGHIVAKVGYKGKLMGAGLEVNISLIEALKVAALKTDNKIDDGMVAMLEAALVGAPESTPA